MSFGTTPVSTTSLSTNQFPVSAVAEPGLAGGNLTALEAGPGAVDSNGNRTAPASMYIKDGNNLTQGAKADSAATDSTSSWSIISLLKGLYAKLAGTLTISGAVTQSGTWTVQPGNTANTTAWKVDGSAVTQPVSGTVTANVGTTNGLALDTSVNGVIVSQGSTTSGEKGPLIQGAVTTGAPTYTTGQTDPLSLTTAGGLRVDGSGVTQPVSAASLPLPTGAATAAKQPALGTAGTASADVISIQGIASMTAVKVDGSGVTQPVSGTVSITANSAVNVAQVNGVTTSTGNGVSGTGVQRVTVASDSTGVLGATQSGTWTVQPGNTPNTSAWLVQDVVASASGAIPYHNITAATTNFTNVKGAACQLYGVDLSNTSGSVIFVKLYDKATTPGTGDTPKRTFQIPANGTLLRVFPKGLKFATGFGWAATGAVADNDNTAIAANCVVDFDLNS